MCAMCEAKRQQNLQFLDILACNSANNPFVQNPTKDGVMTELSTKISRSAVFASCMARILKEKLKKVTTGMI